MSDVERFVEEEKAQLLENFEQKEVHDELGEYFSFVINYAHWVGLGMLYLDESTDARRWFPEVSGGWFENTRSEWNHKLDQGQRIGLLPWLSLYRALQTAVLSCDDETIESFASAVFERATTSELDELPGQEHAHRAFIVRAFAALLLERDDVLHYVDQARTRLADDRYHQGYLGSQVDAIEGIFEDDELRTTEAVENALAFHDESFTDNEDMHFVEELVSADACTFVALARQRGLDVRVDSEYVPEAVYDLA